MEAILQSPLGQTILEHGVVTIGSTPDSQLVVHDARVSPHHAILRPTEQGYTITDWHSAEGTFVNEQRLEPLVPRLLTAGDHIRLGET
ncbi:MAG: FHA domain-containing protein, partial [Ktedonobacteraceae bacterium]